IFRLAELELKHVDEKKLEHDAHYLLHILHTYAHKNELPVTILGPAKPPVSKIKAVHSRKIYLKSENFVYIARVCKEIKHKNFSSSIYFTPNPLV
ncbi:MAG TPA: hypothetical protein VHX42_00890, partial [Candidatus Babeliales bacterium]|nr:hypothetical protein [Candidatus Babeliales bacterium]